MKIGVNILHLDNNLITKIAKLLGNNLKTQ